MLGIWNFHGMDFTYRARDAEGVVRTGRVRAETEDLATSALTERGFRDVALEAAEEPGLFGKALRLRGKIPRKEIVVFARQLSVLASADVPMVGSLRTTAAQTVHPRLREILATIADEVEAGSRLSDAMSEHPEAFSDFLVNMIRSGETSGRLSEVLEYLADQEEKDYDLIVKIRGAMMYPAFIITGMVGVGFVLMTFVIPKLTDVLAQSGGVLPLPTRILVATSGIFARFWWLILIGIAGAVVGLRLYIRTPQGRYRWDRIKLSIPIFGRLFRRIALVRFTRSMETLLSGGVDTTSALAVAADVVGNAVYRNIILETQREVADGSSITSVFERSTLVPTMLPQMLAIGEETGRLTEVLKRLSQFYTREIDNLVANLVNLIEPLIMVVLGVGVGLIVVAVILPMFNLATAF